MKKNIIVLSLIAIVLIAIGIYKFEFEKGDVKQGCTMEAKLCPDGSAVGRTGPKCEFAECPAGNALSSLDPKSGTYVIGGESVTLKDGTNDDSGRITGYFGNEARGDFNGDGVADSAFLLTQDGGGSGTFYYVAAMLSSGSGFYGTNAILLGDRIAPQTTEFRNGRIIVNYADRKPGEPFTSKPSVGVSKYFQIAGNSLLDVTGSVIGSGQDGDTSVSSCTCPAGYYLDGETCNPECYKSTPKCLMPSVACTKPISNFMECVAAGNPVMKTYPARCIANGQTFIEEISAVKYCSDKQRKAEVCAEIYAPVCAKVNIQCIKAPCLPIFETIENPCRACANSLVEFYTNGECPSAK